MKNYIVRRDGEVMGMYYKAGAVIQLTPAQARHLTAPLGSELTEQTEQPKPRRRARFGGR
jgi:hypothetical protein